MVIEYCGSTAATIYYARAYSTPVASQKVCSSLCWSCMVWAMCWAVPVEVINWPGCWGWLLAALLNSTVPVRSGMGKGQVQQDVHLLLLRDLKNWPILKNYVRTCATVTNVRTSYFCDETRLIILSNTILWSFLALFSIYFRM